MIKSTITSKFETALYIVVGWS